MRTRYTLLAGAIIAAFFLQLLSESRIKSPVFDEPAHIAAGLSYVEKHSFDLNPQHPPLLKELSGAFLRASGVRWPAAPGSGLEWEIGKYIISTNGPDRVLFWSRLP